MSPRLKQIPVLLVVFAAAIFIAGAQTKRKSEAERSVQPKKSGKKVSSSTRMNKYTPDDSPVIVLIHSPLVGAFTWSLVADELKKKGFEAIVPKLSTEPKSSLPFWRQHVSSVAESLKTVSAKKRLVLVGHSGAGVLLPAVRQAVKQPVSAYIFVDAVIPENGKSRLELFETPEAAQEFRSAAVSGFLPVWSDEDLREAIPDAEIRRRFVSELRPLPLAVYEEPIPVFPSFPDAPSGYLRFGKNVAYEDAAKRARRENWEYLEIAGGHFQMLVDAPLVADSLIGLIEKMVK